MTRIININKVEETKLWNAINQSSCDEARILAVNIPFVCEEAAERMKIMHTYASQYTLHDDRHLLRVTELMAYILGSEINRLNIVELALLILSAFFHDQGMIPSKTELDSLEKNNIFCLFKDNWLIEHPNYGEISIQLNSNYIDRERRMTLASQLAELDSAMLTDFLRSTHGNRSEEFICSNYKDDHRLEIQGMNICSILGRLCFSHTISCDDITPANKYNFDEQVGRYTVNLPFLAIILRLADILDFDRDRTPEVLLKNIHFTSEVSVREWEKHRSVEGWSISDQRILFTIRCTHPAYEAAARNYMDWIDAELTASQALCRIQPQGINAYQLRLPSKVDRSRIGPLNDAYRAHDLEFSLSRNEIVRLLMLDELYGGEHLCIRELLQNSLDALRYRKALFKEAGSGWDLGQIDFRHYIDSNGYEVLECSDNGAGMDDDIIQNHFVRVGRSYYRSPFFEQERTRLKQSGNDFDPCSKFGIGFMSCFMLGDRITITTRKDYGQGKQWGMPLIIEIHGLSGLLVVRRGIESQPIGTTITIVSRQKPSFLDQWTDRLMLCRVLQGYALATEFPVSATCEVPEIAEVVHLPPQIEKTQTWLETAMVTNCITLEQEFSAVTPNLKGYIRESFLLDNSGLPSLANEAAEWRSKSENYHKSWTLLLLPDALEFKYDDMHLSVPICADGILIAGSPGRPSFRKKVESRLGTINSQINSNAPALIDTRGDMKPELTPARTPPRYFSSVNYINAQGWRRLNEAFRQGQGLLWKQLITYFQHGLGSESFWKLCVVHNCQVSWIPYESLWNNLPVSLSQERRETVWQKVRYLGELSFNKEGNGSFVLQDDTGTPIGPDENLSLWETSGSDHPSLCYQMNAITLLMCCLTIHNEEIVLTPTQSKIGSEAPGQYAYNSGYGVTMFYIDYSGTAGDAITVETPFPTANRNHALSKVAHKCRYFSQLTDLQLFAKSFISCIAESVSTRNVTPNLKTTHYWQKRVGHLFFDVQWDQYDIALRPPYKIWTKESGWTVFDEKDFMKWRDATVYIP